MLEKERGVGVRTQERTDRLEAIREWQALQTSAPLGRDDSPDRLGMLDLRGRTRDMGKPKSMTRKKERRKERDVRLRGGYMAGEERLAGR